MKKMLLATTLVGVFMGVVDTAYAVSVFEDMTACGYLHGRSLLDPAYKSCMQEKDASRPARVSAEIERLQKLQLDQTAERMQAAQKEAAIEQAKIANKGPQKYNLDPLHLMCEGSYNGGKRLDLDIIPREGKAVVTYPDGTNRELPLYSVAIGGRRVATPYGNIVPERFIMAANIGFNTYNDDGWPRIRYYEANKGAEGQYSCNYYRQSLGE
jgi:hypothetical protein